CSSASCLGCAAIALYLLQALEISDEIVKVFALQSERGHVGPGFDLVRILNPLPKVLRCIFQDTARDGRARAEVRQVGPFEVTGILRGKARETSHRMTYRAGRVG